jgi:hypothetical protein
MNSVEKGLTRICSFGMKARMAKGKSSDFTDADITGWFVRVEGNTQTEFMVLIAEDFDGAGKPILPSVHPAEGNPECGFDYRVKDWELLVQWFQECGLEIDWLE